MAEEKSTDSEGVAAIAGEADRASIRHELRTPINHILGMCEMLLEDKELPESYRSDLNRIHQSGHTLLSLMGNFFDEGSIREGEDKHRVLHDLRTPVNHIMGYSEMLTEEAADEGRAQLESDLRQIGKAAQTWLSRMEQNLVELDSGDDTKNTPDRDSLLEQLAAAQAPKGERETEIGRILVVDDDALNRDILVRRLQQQGHEVEMASDGQEGLDRLKTEDFDLVLLDMIMPGLSGVDVLIQMKKDLSLSEIPVIVISALDDESGIARCIELGAEDYLAKPFNPAVLRARIGTSLEKRRLRSQEKEHLCRIQEERRKSERLLLNILPEAVADRLKSGEEEIADHFADVTVLFADLVDFTVMSAKDRPEKIVGMLNRIFSSFDLIADRHGLEKIKTIGDAYMVVGGLPLPRDDHAEAIAGFALDVMDEVAKINEEFGSTITLRVGIDSGPVVAGIIGLNKFIYDLWGDTVNTASRMESHGESGRIQVTDRTRLKLEKDFKVVPRGEIAVKGKGKMKTWFLERNE